MVACITIILAISTAVSINQTQASLADDLLKRGESQALVLASAANAYVAEGNTSQLTVIAAVTTSQHEIQYIAFYDAQNALLASAVAPTASAGIRTSFIELRNEVEKTSARAFNWSADYLDIVVPMTWIGQRIGYIGLRIDTGGLVRARAQAVTQGAVNALILIFLLNLALGLFLQQLIIRPLQRLSTTAEQISQGVSAAVPGQQRRDELGLLARSFAQMVAALQSREQQLQEQIVAVNELNTALDSKVVERTAQLHNLVAGQEQLLNQIHEMSIPVVPVLEGVIVVPLIGVLDNSRADRMMQNVLAGVEQQHADMAILDITGVPVVDTQVAHAIIQVTQATQLLGTKTVLVGIRPEVASTLVLLGVDLREVQTFATLQEALRTALQERAGRNGASKPLGYLAQ
jgi:anti-anti-sigma regulatory factor/HAMP domain-containing protein